MLVLGHAGIVLGTVWALATVVGRRSSWLPRKFCGHSSADLSHPGEQGKPPLKNSVSQRSPGSADSVSGQASVYAQRRGSVPALGPVRTGRLAALARGIDYRLVLLGALLPDVVDKLVGQVLFREAFSNGRIFAHTLLFPVVMAMVGGYLYAKYARSALLLVSFCCLVHLLSDEMWLEPKTLLWPIYGWGFERIDLTDYLSTMWHKLWTAADVFVPETIGAAILVAFALNLVRTRCVSAFLRNGLAEQPVPPEKLSFSGGTNAKWHKSA